MGQVPQSSGFPQPSLTAPHWKPSVAQVCGTQVAQAWPFPLGRHVFPTGHVPQLIAAPQPFTTTPHVASSSAQVVKGSTHFMVPRSQYSVALQPPQSIVPPHSFE